jgi:hypothetical protein
MTAMAGILALHAFCTLFMTGLIWFVQVVHYPLFQLVGEAGFASYEQEHTRRATWVVAPVMCVEAISAVALLCIAPAGMARALSLLGVSLVALIWVSTGFVQVPCHGELVKGYDRRAADRLVATNWIRTAAWTARACLAVAIWTLV